MPSKDRVFFLEDVRRFPGDFADPDFLPPPPLRFAAVFLRVGARRADFFAADFRRVVRFAALLLPLDFLADDFRLVDFFAAPRLATPRRATFLRADFLRPPFRAAI